MPTDSPAINGKIPTEKDQLRSAEFFAQVSDMLDGKPKDPNAVEDALSGWDDVIERIATELYQIGTMLLGEGEETIAAIEKVVTDADVAVCKDYLEARHNARVLLGSEAIQTLSRRNESAFTAPEIGDSGPESCIEDDDLSAAGVTHAELEAMLNGPDNQHLRSWLEGLSPVLRTIFVLRAVGGLSSPEVAGLLAQHGGPVAQNWTPDSVRSSYRQALCSLASQLLHSRTGA